MKRYCLFLVTVLIVQKLLALSFDTEGKRCQDYVVSQLVNAIRAKDRIVLINSQKPATWKDPDEVEPAGISYRDAYLLDLDSISPVESLKGNFSARVQGCALLYSSDGREIAKIDGEYGMVIIIDEANPPVPIPYRPSLSIYSNEELCRLVFVRPQREPLTKRVWNARSATSSNPARDSQFEDDAHTLPVSEFMAKYNLGQVFSNSVYQIAEGCMFILDHPKFKLVDEKTKTASGNIYLAAQEVSEIVYLAYLEEDKRGGAAKYAEAVRQSQILQPMPKAEFKTLIGQKLHAALSDPEYGMAEKRAQEEKERQAREVAQQKVKLRAEIDALILKIEKAQQMAKEDMKQLDSLIWQFCALPEEKGRAQILKGEKDTSLWSIEKVEVFIRQLKLFMSKEHEGLDWEMNRYGSTAWSIIIEFLKSDHFQVGYSKQYDDILRKVQGLPLDPEQVKEVEDAVAEMEANRKKYAR